MGLFLKKTQSRTNLNLWQRAKTIAPGGVHSPVRSFQSVGGEPIFFHKAKGAYLWDCNTDKRYIDFCMSFGPLILGHRDRDVLRVVQKAAKIAWSFGACEPYSLALAEFLHKELPWLEKVRFVSSGTEAVMSTIRLARAATNREGILKFIGTYHGHVDSLLVKAGSGLATFSQSDSAGVGKAQIQNTYLLPLDENEKKLENFFKEKGKKIAVVIIEPLPANYGLLIQRKAFLEKVAKLAKEYGALLLFDEVISGFRVGLKGMTGYLGIQPDLLCLGKIIGGGFPIGAYGGKKELMDWIAPEGSVYQAGTLSANPFSMMAGLATLEKCKNEEIYPELKYNTESFSKNLESLLNSYTSMDWEIISFESLFWIKKKTNYPVRSVEKIHSEQKENYASIYHILLEAGIYFAPSAFEVGFLSLAHKPKILEKALSQIESVFQKK